jgi:hypothetical protein
MGLVYHGFLSAPSRDTLLPPMEVKAVQRPPWRVLGAAGIFLAIWACLDVLVNLRAPTAEPSGWYFLPSLDVTALLVLFAVLGWRGWRLPSALTVVLAVLFVAARIFRLGEALVLLNYYRALNLTLDLPLVPELARLMHSTLSVRGQVGGALISVAAIAGLGVLVWAGLRYCQRYLHGRAGRVVLAATVLLAVVLSPLWPSRDHHLHRGLFGASLAPAVVEQVRFAISANALRRAKAAELAAVQERLASTPHDLGRVRGVDVFLFYIESYGRTALFDRRFSGQMQAVLASFAGAASKDGYAVASRLLDSSTYGGGSWFAHATMATGVRVTDGLEFAVVRNSRPPPTTLAALLRQAGHRTVLVQPGTTRAFPEGLVHGFDRRYYAPDLQYAGPAFGWATMPDQYAIGFVHEHEVAAARTPIYAEYALVSSHAPWTVLPPLVEDWSRLGNGEIYRTLAPQRFNVRWEKLHEGGDAYVASLRYDFAVLQRYLALLTRPSLVIVMGDHQPAGSVTEQDPSYAVPVHVMGRQGGLVDAFIGRGYARGMMPGPDSAPMDTFLTEFLATLSGGDAP